MSGEDGLPPLRTVISELGLTAKKSLGQNFILDLNLTRRIARTAGPFEGITVLEVGAGPGGLTRALLMEGAEHVIALERDARCIGALDQIANAYPNRLSVRQVDALDVDYADLAEGPLRIVANLPYGVATPLLIGWLRTMPWPPWYDRMVLMFQREVADRIVAEPGSKVFGRLSVISQWRCHVRPLLTLPPAAFTPAPKVSSSLVEFTPRRSREPACSLQALEAVSKAAFGQRRKMLKSSLRQISEDAQGLIDRAGLDPTVRPETLTIEQFGALALAYAAEADL